VVRLTSDGTQPARHNLMTERPFWRMVAKATRMLFRNEREAWPPFLSCGASPEGELTS